MELTIAGLVGLERCVDIREAGYRDSMATRAIQGVLDTTVPQWKPGRPSISTEILELIRTISTMNTTWGSPHIVGELAKLGIVVAKSTVKKYMVRTKKPPSRTWRSF